MREFNDVSGPFTRMREDGYFPFVQAQYLLCQSHADAVAGCHIFVFATVEELEQVLFVLVRHAHTVVRKADDGPFFPERNLDKRSLVPGVLAIIFDEVYERCCKQVTITDHCEYLGRLRLPARIRVPHGNRGTPSRQVPLHRATVRPDGFLLF